LGRVECVRCGLLRSMIPASVSLSVTRLRCANTAEWIDILIVVENLGDPRNIRRESRILPTDSAQYLENYFANSCFLCLCTGLLATTLFTFQDYACDNDVLRMRCPRDTVISVQWAQYGRLATSANNDLCPAVTWKPLAGRRAAEFLQQPSPRSDWLSPPVSTTTVAMTTAVNQSSWRRAAERITCLASKSLEV